VTVQYSVAVRNAKLDAVETAISTSPILRIRTGAQPANAAAADAGSVLASLTLPSDWLNNASGGTKTLLGSWTAAASGTGTAAHFRIYDSGGTVCHIQGSFGTSATDMIGDSTNFTSGQTFTVTAFTLTAGNA
jgi:hypothetical protein